jgi:choline dehydrogenase
MQDRYETTVVGEAPTAFEITKDCTFGYSEPDPCLEQFQTHQTALGKGTYATNGIAVAVLRQSSVASGGDTDLFISGAPAYFKGCECRCIHQRYCVGDTDGL